MIQEAVKPGSIKEAESLRAQGWAYMAGGTLINWVASPLKPEKVVLLEGLVPGTVGREGDDVVIGAMATLQSVVDAEAAPEALRHAAGMIPSRNIRNMATIGGNIAANRPDSYVIPALLALDARVVTTGAGEMPLMAYLREGKGALITQVRIPPVSGNIVVDRAVRSSAAYPAAIVAVRGSENACVIALGCVANHCVRLESVEGKVTSGELKTEEDVFQAVYDAIEPPDSLKESAAYKRTIAATLAARAVMACRGNAASSLQ